MLLKKKTLSLMEKLKEILMQSLLKPLRIQSLKETVIGGKVKGDINSDRVHIKKTADVDGTIKQKTLSIEEGSLLTIKTEIKK